MKIGKWEIGEKIIIKVYLWFEIFKKNASKYIIFSASLHNMEEIMP